MPCGVLSRGMKHSGHSDWKKATRQEEADTELPVRTPLGQEIPMAHTRVVREEEIRVGSIVCFKGRNNQQNRLVNYT